MSFEDEFRSTLHAQVDDLDLRGRGATEVMHLARRRQHRARRAGAVAAVGVLGLGVVGTAAARRTDGVAVTSGSDQVGLPDVGPLALSWQATPGGVTGGVTGHVRFFEEGGVLYALSTAPGAQYPTDGSVAAMAPALYRLADDGTWDRALAEGAVPMNDVVAAGSVLYAIGTAPATSGAGFDAVVSASADGGATWARSTLAPVPAPSTVVAWEASGTSVAVERVPGATVAVVSTTFAPPWSLVEQAARAAGVTSDDDYGFEVTDAGIDIVSYATPFTGDGSAVSTTVLPTSPPPADAPSASAGTTPADSSGTVVPEAPIGAATPTSIAPDGARIYADGADLAAREQIEASRQVLATIAWSDLGVSGRADLTDVQVLVERDGTWTPVASPALAGVSISGLTVAGQDLVLDGWDNSTRSLRHFASSDGSAWRPIAVGDQSRLGGLGNAWIDVPWGSDGSAPVVRSSFDQGASWTTVDLGAVDGRLAPSIVTSFDSGPLGLAAVAVDRASSTGFLVTTRDLESWTVTPLAEVTGGLGVGAEVHVGADRVVLTAGEGYREDGVIPASVTAIGTPVR